jgi:hypothetical protein
MTDAAALRVEDTPPVMATARAALYLRVSTGRQAESDLSIPISAARSKAIACRAAGRSRPSSSSRATPRRTIVAPPSRR